VGSERGKHLRNIAIIVALALVVWLVPGGERAGLTISNLLTVVFVGGLLFFGYRLYMEHRESLFALPERQRGILYAAAALGTITIVATRRMWEGGGLGAVLWLAFLALAIWGLVSVWRAYREY
jgi:amino acid permease